TANWRNMGSNKSGKLARTWIVYIVSAVVAFAVLELIPYVNHHVPFFRDGGVLGLIAFLGVWGVIALLYFAVLKYVLAPFEKRLLGDTDSSKQRDPNAQ
ncbi:MAG TPA: hypothetical protein VGX96_19785, partial [Candidatus Elarobacter sp.]|nr:hypothetical protein [Candidatus Elarobacter sp.]